MYPIQEPTHSPVLYTVTFIVIRTTENKGAGDVYR